MRKSAKSLAASNIWSFLKSALRQVGGTRLGSDAPSQNASMSLSLNLIQPPILPRDVSIPKGGAKEKPLGMN